MSAASALVREKFLAALPIVTDEFAARKHITFGRHRGRLVCEVPTDYLKWMVESFQPEPAETYELAAAVIELKRREQLERRN